MADDDGDRFDPVDRGVVDATVAAIESARDSGIVTDMDEGAAIVLLRMAERMDDPDFPYIDGRFDNVTEGLYMKAARELGLTVAGRVALPERKEAKRGKLAVLRDAEVARGRASG